MKRNILASLAILVAITFVCVSALALDVSDVVGEWYFNALEQNGTTHNPSALGMGMMMMLNEDGTVLLSYMGEDAEDEEDDEITWAITGDVLSIGSYEETYLELILLDDMLIADIDEDGIMVFGRELIIEITHADFPIILATDIAEFNGEWVGDLVEMLGMMLPMDSELVGKEIRLSIQNGEIILHEADAWTDPTESILQGTMEDGTLVTAFEKYGEQIEALLNLREDGSLSFAAGEYIMYYFVKGE